MGLIQIIFGLLKLVLTPISALLNVVGLNDVISQISTYLSNLLEMVMSGGVGLAAYFFNWTVVKAVFSAWLIIEGAERAYALYRFVRKNTV